MFIFRKLGDMIVFLDRNFKGILLFILILILFLPMGEDATEFGNLQEIKLTGEIVDASEVLKEIDEAKENDEVKGVLFNIDSPGGSVPPSIEIAHAIKELKSKKPVVAYTSGSLASGSYYSSIYANKIVANPGSIVGSIGVIMESANVKELLDTVGIKPQVVKMGLYKEAGTPTREWTPEERIELETLARDTYNKFVSDVATARKLDIKKANSYANAHVFSAQRAKSLGLIDEVATINRAKEILYTLSKVEEPIWIEKDKVESFMDELSSEAISQIYMFSSAGLKSKFEF
ncbi:MAG: endopeptidase IV [Sulfurovum sp. AS07-7]|nr:MAG: endopeptidase IV [Sulfurovum sp. AS07-7]